ncbi:MAG: acyltransferase family protein, partial [Bacteroidales bacterium]|nr:acyltransferase family protein [Bacteroidales bacterium]
RGGGWWYNIYSAPKLETYWFLYLYLGFLLLLPLLRKMASGMTDTDYGYLFGFSCVSSVLTMFGYFSGCFINNGVFALPSVFLYPLLGYWIDRKPCTEPAKDALKYGLTALVPLCVIVPASLLFAEQGDFMDAVQVFTPLISFGIFGLAKSAYAGHPRPARLEKAILAVGHTTFGIYLIEDVIRNQIIKILPFLPVNGFARAALYTLSTFTVGVIAVSVMKKIPILKKLM